MEVDVELLKFASFSASALKIISSSLGFGLRDCKDNCESSFCDSSLVSSGSLVNLSNVVINSSSSFKDLLKTNLIFKFL